jgi:hypothetical protein
MGARMPRAAVIELLSEDPADADALARYLKENPKCDGGTCVRITVAATAVCIASIAPVGAQQFPDALFCQVMEETAAKSNKDTGSKVDAVATHMGIAVLCNMKVVDFKKHIDVPFGSFEAGWEDRRQAQWNQIYCNNLGFSQAIANGWRISATKTLPMASATTWKRSADSA